MLGPENWETWLDLEAGAGKPIGVSSGDDSAESVDSSMSDRDQVLHESWLDADAQVLTDLNLLENMQKEVESVLAAGKM